MGRQKKGNPNAQRNNNAKQQKAKAMPSYAEMEAEKLKNPQE
ncbi:MULTISPECIES: hypothetical protein [Bacillales]|nr:MULTISPECIES: hypothetical protein [Bacillaceae]MDO6655774.1 hypothetical protein [Anaerobacillus sp. 1_MG-2023]WLR59881.1 hypothetical protein LC071_00235 [Pseudalkalibacillus hwajinpoensis]